MSERLELSNDDIRVIAIQERDEIPATVWLTRDDEEMNEPGVVIMLTPNAATALSSYLRRAAAFADGEPEAPDADEEGAT